MINEMYPLAALFIHATNQEITKERMVAVLSALGVESQTKICEFFEMDAIKMKDLLASSAQGGPAPSVQATQAAPAATDGKGAEAVADDEAPEIDFDFF